MLEKRIEDLRCRTEKLLDKIRRIDGGLNRRISKTGEVKWKIKTFMKAAYW